MISLLKVSKNQHAVRSFSLQKKAPLRIKSTPAFSSLSNCPKNNIIIKNNSFKKHFSPSKVHLSTQSPKLTLITKSPVPSTQFSFGSKHQFYSQMNHNSKSYSSIAHFSSLCKSVSTTPTAFTSVTSLISPKSNFVQIREYRGPSKHFRNNLIDVLSKGTLHTKTIVQNMDKDGWVELDLIYKLYPTVSKYLDRTSIDEAVERQTSSDPNKIIIVSEDKKKIRLKQNTLLDRIDNDLRKEIGVELSPIPYPPATFPIVQHLIKVPKAQE